MQSLFFLSLVLFPIGLLMLVFGALRAASERLSGEEDLSLTNFAPIGICLLVSAVVLFVLSAPRLTWLPIM